MRSPTASAILLTLCSAISPLAAAQAMDREISTAVPADQARSVRLVLPIGDIEVRGDGGAEVRAELVVHCRHRRQCEDRADQVFLDTSRKDDRVLLAVRGYPRLLNSENMELRGVIHVPAGLPLTIDMHVGELRINDVDSDVRVDMGVGDVHLSLPASRVGRVRLGSNVGDATLRSPQGRFEAERSFLVGAKLRWNEGPGEALVDIDLGVGDVTVDLD